MDTEIRIYKKTILLDKPFRSASGAITSKTTLIFDFLQNLNQRFLFEMPLSPSLGESVEQVEKLLVYFSSIKKASHSSPSIHKALTFANAYFNTPRILDRLFKNSHRTLPSSIVTVTAGENFSSDDTLFKSTEIIKFKVFPNNLEALIQATFRISQPWIADFNGSLTAELF
jgi:hypothetical protein